MQPEKANGVGVIRNTARLSVVVLGLAASASLCHAADIFYDDSGSNFSDGGSWIGNVAPSPGDNAIFDTGAGLVTIDFIQNNTIDSLQLRNSNVSFDLAGRTFSLLQPPPAASLLVYDPAGGSASATFTSGKVGGVLGVWDVNVVAEIGGTSTLTFTGSDLSVLPVSPADYTIGDTGGGASFLTISNGASVSLDTLTVNKTGTVTVISNSLLNVSGDILIDGGDMGNLETGNFSWSSGNTLTVTNGGDIGFSGSSYTSPLGSSFIVTGNNSTVSGAGITFNLANSSQIQVTSGGAWTKSLDVTGGSTVTADGAGSALGRFDIIDGSVTLSNGANASGSIYNIGDSGSGATGTLNINSASTLNATSTYNVSSSSSDSSGIVNINGTGSQLTTNSTATVGSGGGSTGVISLVNGGAYNIDGTTSVNATGTISVVSGGLNVNNTLNITGGVVSINDQGSLNSDPASEINVTSNGLLEFTDLTATINLDDGNTILISGASDQPGTPSTLHAYDNLDVEQNTILFATSDGVINVDDALRVLTGGSVTAQNGGVLNVANNITVDNGSIFLDTGGLVWGANKSMSVTNGGNFNVTSGFAFDSADMTVDGAGSQVTGAGVGADLTNASNVVVTNGGRWTKSVDVETGSTMLADGPGSELGSFDIVQGTVTLTNGAQSSGSLYRVGALGGSGTTGTLNILNGSTLESTFIGFIVSNFSTHSEGVVNVDGGSSLIVQEAEIGSDAGSAGTVNIINGSSYTASVKTTLRNTGTLNIDGGTALLGDFVDLGGTINFTSGTFGHNGDFRIGAGGLVGSNVDTSTRSLIFGGTVTIDANATVNLDGGILSAGAFVRNGTINFTAGRLEVTNSDMDADFGGLLGRTPMIGAGQELAVYNNLNVSGVGLLTISGGSVYATALNNSGYVQMNSVGSLLDGGTVNNDGVLAGTGVVNAQLQNNAAGEVRVGAGDNLIFTAGGNSNNGLIYNDGGSLRFAGSLANQSNGVISGRGAMRFTGGLTNNGDLNFSQGESNIYGNIVNGAAGQVSVAGVANTSFFGSLVNNGDVFVGQDSRIVFFGDVSGPGSYSGGGLVEFAGGFSPGASPASVAFQGDVSLTGLSNLLIELGGLTPGDAFDQLVVSGDIALGGTLDIQLLGGFVPSPGDSFQIITAGQRLGTFAGFTSPSLPNGMSFDVQYDPTGVTLLVLGGGLEGDLNGDGFVGIADLNLVLGNWNQTVPPANPLADPSGDNFIGIADLNTVLGNWNAGTPPNTSTTIPEPGTLVLFTLGGLLVSRKRLRK